MKIAVRDGMLPGSVEMSLAMSNTIDAPEPPAIDPMTRAIGSLSVTSNGAR